MGIAASHRKLAFDKDYMLILGCRVRKDGTPTPLLKGRADAALKFAENQKQATGNELIFVPSGGQGKDEAVSEAECIKNYLLSCGINEKRILVATLEYEKKKHFSAIGLLVIVVVAIESLLFLSIVY
ncbi:MAG: YdcF family protein [Lachnospiraceae bacterium]|nr:YdcF family protein [Lachnospiraceae bacterium]